MTADSEAVLDTHWRELVTVAMLGTDRRDPPAPPPGPVVAFDVVQAGAPLGTITLVLWPDKSPLSVANFLEYLRSGHYDGTIFHRVIPNFMIQGGGMDDKMSANETRAPIKNEADNGLKNLTGTIAMARTSDPHSATAQFFINVSDNAFLDFKSATPQGWGYAVFGKVTDGRDVVRSIEKVQTGNKAGHQDVPLTDVVINKVIIEE